MPSRNQIKWAPFNSVMNGKRELIKLGEDRKKLGRPVISDDQIECFNLLIMESLNNKVMLRFNVYLNGFVYKKESTVRRIDSLNGIIYLDDNEMVNFSDIVSVERI